MMVTGRDLRRGLIVAALLMLVLPMAVNAEVAAMTALSADLREPPYGGKTPVPVSIGLFITNLASIVFATPVSVRCAEIGNHLPALPISGNQPHLRSETHHQ
jgi:hypothetical protein